MVVTLNTTRTKWWTAPHEATSQARRLRAPCSCSQRLVQWCCCWPPTLRGIHSAGQPVDPHKQKHKRLTHLRRERRLATTWHRRMTSKTTPKRQPYAPTQWHLVVLLTLVVMMHAAHASHRVPCWDMLPAKLTESRVRGRYVACELRVRTLIWSDGCRLKGSAAFRYCTQGKTFSEVGQPSTVQAACRYTACLR